MKNIFSSKIFVYSGLVISGLLMGWLFFHSPEKHVEKLEIISPENKSTIWTCAMHPQIRMHEPGKCPICAMELIPLNQNTDLIDQSAVHFTRESAALANVQTSVVSKQEPIIEVRLYGKIQSDERLLQNQVAHFSGRIEKLLVNFTGESVQKGQVLALIYSPEMVTAQQELLEAGKMRLAQPEIYEAAKERLRQWKLSESQITNLENSGSVKDNFELVSTSTGVVTSRRVNVGDYISRGTVLFDIADLSRVWAMFDAYESDLPFLSKGDKISFSVQALPGVNFEGNIAFIDPVIDAITRVAKVRAEISNQAGKLKPEMFATGMISANLNEYRNNLIIPGSAVLWTGKRSVVYVKQQVSEELVFTIREIEIGPMLGESYVVINGLKEGEEIVTQGTFSVDAAAQLEGKPSMMNPQTSPEKDGSKKEVSNQNERINANPLQSEKSKVLSVSFDVSGNCEMCKDRIEAAAKSVKGVSLAEWDINAKKIHVEYEATTSLMGIHTAIAKAGHDTDKVKTDDKTYSELPECCLYRKEN